MQPEKNGESIGNVLSHWLEFQRLGQADDAQKLLDQHPELLAKLVLNLSAIADPEGDPLDPGSTLSITPGSENHRLDTSSRRMTSGGAFADLRYHASGGLGEVYQARQPELNRDVALKFLKANRADDPESLRRFLQEAEVTGRLEHPGVVPVYGMGRDEDGYPCYAMRFIRGETLQDALDAFHLADKPDRDPSERSLALRGLLNRFVSVCNTIAYAHSRGILHRDIKPRNIMLGRYDETLVVDWGLAKPFDRGVVRGDSAEETLSPGSGSGLGSPTTHGAVGTPSYMSPEQINGEPQGPASDVYGLGATLYSLLTGQPPLRGEDLRVISERIRRRDFPKPHELKPSVPLSLEAVCLKAMEPIPGDRYQSALELSRDVELWLADEPVSARREPAALRAARWLRRHRTVLAASLVLMTSSIVALSVTLVLVSRERSAAVASEEKARKKFDLARRTVNELLVYFADQRFANVPQMDTQRRQTANEAVAFNEEFLAERGDDPNVQREAALVFVRVANMHRFIGELDRARVLYRRSIGLYEGLLATSSEDREVRRLLADAKTHQAVALRLSGRSSEALSVFREAVALSEALPGVATAAKGARLPSTLDQDEVQTVARALLDLASLLEETGQLEEAKTAVSRSVEMSSRLVEGRSPKPPLPARLLIVALMSRGTIEGELGDRPTALATLSKASDLNEELARLAPKDVDFKHLRGKNLIEQGRIFALDPDRRKDAVEAFRKASEIEADLVSDFPKGVVYKLNQAIALAELGQNLARLGPDSLETAEAASRQARQLLDGIISRSERAPGVKDALGLALANLSRLAESKGNSAEAQDLRKLAEREIESALRANPRSPVANEALKRLQEP